jgi:hypothetical protein
MTQRELNRAVARATGEDVEFIDHLGFGPLTVGPVERDPGFVDWDELDADRGLNVFAPGRRQLAAA